MREVPHRCRAVIRIASWIVPRRRRREWRVRREYELWNWWNFLTERGELTPAKEHEIFRQCFRAFPDAFWIRFEREQLLPKARRFARGPSAVLAVALLALVAIAVLSRGFSGSRTILRPAIDYPNPNELLVVRLERAMGMPHTVQSRVFAAWLRQTATLKGGAAYLFRSLQVDGEQGRVRPVAEVTSDFFTLLGGRPRLGRFLLPGDSPNTAVVSHWFWRWHFNYDHGIIGRVVSIGDDRVRIVGVLPDGYAVIGGAALITPMEINPDSRMLVGVVVRVIPGVSQDQVARELTSVADHRTQVPILSRPILISFAERSYTPLFGLGLALGFGVVIGVVMIQVRKPALPPVSHASMRSRIRYWAFFAAKTTLLIAVLLALWIEGPNAMRSRFEPGPLRDIGLLVVPALVFFVTCALTVYWSFYDQRSRCPQCLELLSLPVTIGSWASALLEPVSTEMICERGHGALCVPETSSSSSEPERWTALDDSWKELFTK